MERKDSRVSKRKRTILLSSRYRHAWRSFINCTMQLNKRDTFKPRNEIVTTFSRTFST